MTGWLGGRSWRAWARRGWVWLTWALGALLVVGPAGLASRALAQSTGGSVGGSDWGGGSSSSGGGSSSGGWSGSSSSGGSHGASNAYEPPMWAQLLIAIAFMVFLYFFFTWLARVTSPPRIVVSVARVAVDARARRFVQGRLDELAKTADTRSTAGLSALLRAGSNALIASRLAWIYVSAQTRTPETPEAAREHHKRITDDARARFRHELVRHAEGKKTVEDAPLLSAREHEGEGTVVVTIVVAATAKLPRGGETAEAADALLAGFATLGASEIKAVEIVWSPAAETDRMSTDELETHYPDLTKITAVGGRVFCAHCGGPHTAELAKCPHCGAPVTR